MTTSTTTKAMMWMGLGVTEVALILSDAVTGVGYDLLLSAVVLTILGAIVWAMRIIVPAHVKALEVMQMTTVTNSETIDKISTAIITLTNKVETIATQSSVDSNRLTSIEIAVKTVLSGLESVGFESGVNLEHTKEKVEQLIGNPESNPKQHP